MPGRTRVAATRAFSLSTRSLPARLPAWLRRALHQFKYTWPFVDGCALVVVVLAGLSRLALVLAGWPASDSDESTMGIMALHIVAHADFPVFLYGQPYMGALEAYLAAVAFHVFGPSLVTLRLGMVLMATLWLGVMYALGRLLYTPWLAVFCCALLAIGPPEGLYRELFAGGGYVETLFASTLLMLLAARLAMTSRSSPERSTPPSLRRLAGFAAWGLVAGLGVWSDTLVLPFAVCSGLVLVAFCRCEWRTALPPVLSGLLAGALPLAVYAISTPDHNPLAGALAVQRSSNAWSGNIAALLIGQVVGTLAVALPIITGGGSLCALPTNASWPLAHATAQTLVCTGVHGLWGFGYVALLAIALIASLRAVGRLRADGSRANLARESVRLALLAAAALTLLLFLSSPVAARSPNVVMRYLIGLLVATPAVTAPLWSLAARIAGLLRQGSPALQPMLHSLGAQWRVYSAIACLVVVVAAYGAGAGELAQMVPSAHATNQRQTTIATYLLAHGLTRVYSDYWTCGWLIFDSREHVICAVLDTQLRPGFDRFLPYRALVHEGRAAAYIFAPDSGQEATFEARIASSRTGPTYLRETVEGYVVYRSSAVPSASVWPGTAE